MQRIWWLCVIVVLTGCGTISDPQPPVDPNIKWERLEFPRE